MTIIPLCWNLTICNHAGVQDIDLGFGKLAYAYFPNHHRGDYRVADSSRGFHGYDGWMLTLMHQQNNLWGGFNKIALQYGKGSARTLASFSDDTNKNGATWRIVEQHQVELSSSWSALGTLEYQDCSETAAPGTATVLHLCQLE